MRTSDTSNPYAPAPEESLASATEAAAKPSPAWRKTFRWQVLPSLFCSLATAFCLFLICVLAFQMVDVHSRRDGFSVPNAHLLALLSDIFIVFSAAIAFAFAALRWFAFKYITAMVSLTFGAMLLALVIPNEYWLLDFWQDVTLRFGWDTYD